MKKIVYVILTQALLSSVMVMNGYPQSYDLKKFPKGSEPKEIGIKLTERYLASPHSDWGNINLPFNSFVTYPDVCTWLGGLWFAKSIKNDQLCNELAERFEPLFTTEKHMQPDMRPAVNNVVDYYVFGAVPLEIYKRNKDPKYLELGLRYADRQWTLPAEARESEKKWHDQGYSWQTRLWIDDMFMITAVQVQAYLVTGDRKYIDRATNEMVLYLDNIQRSNGLFYHAPEVPVFWGRGNGWMAVGMTELLRMLPEDNPYKNRVKAAYRLMMQTLLRYQAHDGMWRQIIDDPNSYKETSASAMFTYAMIVGVKNGWLDKKLYGEAARKAWLSLLTYLDENDNLRNVCVGTGIKKGDYNYYLNRPQRTGDLHGQAPLIWCAFALLGDVRGK